MRCRDFLFKFENSIGYFIQPRFGLQNSNWFAVYGISLRKKHNMRNVYGLSAYDPDLQWGTKELPQLTTLFSCFVVMFSNMFNFHSIIPCVFAWFIWFLTTVFFMPDIIFDKMNFVRAGYKRRRVDIFFFLSFFLLCSASIKNEVLRRVKYAECFR